MRKILIASGDSWTNPKFKSDFHEELDCSWPKWPSLLSNKLNMECINLGRSGAGNEYIYTSLVDEIIKHDPNKIGYVMAGWSRAIRRDFSINHNYSNLRMDTHGDMYYHVKKSLNYFYSLQQLCNNLNIKLIQFCAINLFAGNFPDDDFKHYSNTSDDDVLKYFINTDYYKKIDDKLFFGWPISKKLGGYNMSDIVKSSVISKLDRHPNKHGQVIIAEKIYENL